MQFEISILEHRSFETLSLKEKVELRKSAGNNFFAYLEYSKAARCYSNGVKLAEKYFTNRLDGQGPTSSVESMLNSQRQQIQRADSDVSPAEYSGEELELMQVYIDCLNNLAACYLSMQEYAKARDACIRILEVRK